jgi:hypothetical protein
MQEGKLFPVHAMKTYNEVEVQIPSFLTSEVSGQLHVPAPLPTSNNSQYQLPKRLCGPLHQYGRLGKGNTPSTCLDSNLGSSRPHSSLGFEAVDWFNL